MNDKQIITMGLAVFGCSLVVVFVGLNAWGQIKGTFAYVPTPELVELTKWIFGASLGFGAGGAVTAAVVAVRGAGGGNDESKN